MLPPGWPVGVAVRPRGRGAAGVRGGVAPVGRDCAGRNMVEGADLGAVGGPAARGVAPAQGNHRLPGRRDRRGRAGWHRRPVTRPGCQLGAPPVGRARTGHARISGAAAIRAPGEVGVMAPAGCPVGPATAGAPGVAEERGVRGAVRVAAWRRGPGAYLGPLRPGRN